MRPRTIVRLTCILAGDGLGPLVPANTGATATSFSGGPHTENGLGPSVPTSEGHRLDHSGRKGYNNKPGGAGRGVDVGGVGVSWRYD